MEFEIKAINVTSFIIFCFSAFFFCYRSCDKLPRSSSCFFCLRIRSRDFEKSLDIVIDQCDFEENFCDIVGSLIDLSLVLKGQFTSQILSRKIHNVITIKKSINQAIC